MVQAVCSRSDSDFRFVSVRILGVSPASVRVWLSEDGHLRFPNARRFGHVWQIPESDLAGLPRGRKRGRPKKEGAKKASKKGAK